jgi:hypothetical protein
MLSVIAVYLFVVSPKIGHSGDVCSEQKSICQSENRPSNKIHEVKNPLNQNVTLGKILDETIQIGILLAGDLLLREALNPRVHTTQKRYVYLNSSAIIRYCKAYLFYLQQLSNEFGSYQSTWDTYKQRIHQLSLAANLLGRSALGKQDAKGLVKALDAIQQWNFVESSISIKLTGQQMEILLDAIAALSTGIEITSYYRLRQLASVVDTKQFVDPKIDVNNLLFRLQKFLRYMQRHRVNMLQLQKKYPQEKGTAVFLYHCSLVVRAGNFLGRLLLKSDDKRLVYQKKYYKDIKELRSSLQKANNQFVGFWKMLQK